MTARTPWLGERTGATVSFGSTLPREGGAASTSWAARDQPETNAGANPGATGCHRCRDLGSIASDQARARAEATAAGREEGLAETRHARDRLEAAAAAVTLACTIRDDAVVELIVDVALSLCAEMAPAAAAVDRRGLVQLVSRALGDAGSSAPGGARELVLRMCADDVAAIGGQLPAGVACEVGAGLTHGEVWVEAPRLVVDGRWAPRLAAMREPLLALVRAAEPAFELATEEQSANEEQSSDGA